MQTRTLASLAEVSPDQWNHLVKHHNPFLSHEFLIAMERHGCVGERTGWLPRHVVCEQGGRLLAAMPLYLKDNFYGEFVFDHSWEAAYRRYGLPYYPKLVSAVPFTPATGQRLLVADDADPAVAQQLLSHALELAQTLGCSSLHCLFPAPENLTALRAAGLMQRLGCQFHWHNQGYRDFDDFLDTLVSKKRKNIKRERRSVEQSGYEVRFLHGPEINDRQWQLIHDFYCSTFERRWGFAALTLPFFQELGATLGEQVVIAMAYDGPQEVAAAICFRSDDTLYGRHWGSRIDTENLHFETCYYQGIDYCIRHGLQRFEPGAQGEHKISRGFLPTLTYSAHWLAHPAFNEAIADFLDRESPAVQAYARELSAHSPYRQESSGS